VRCCRPCCRLFRVRCLHVVSWVLHPCVCNCNGRGAVSCMVVGVVVVDAVFFFMLVVVTLPGCVAQGGSRLLLHVRVVGHDAGMACVGAAAACA